MRRWNLTQFETWFIAYHSSDDGLRRCAQRAAARFIPDLTDDLLVDWYLSVKTTIDRLRSDRGELPEWLNDETMARRYVLRALDNDAIDLVRQRSRLPRQSLSQPDGQIESHVAHGEHLIQTSGADDLDIDWHLALDGVARDLTELLAQSAGGCVGCTSLMTVRLSMAVLELFRDHRSAVVSDTQIAGGTDEWDRAVYSALERVAPDRVRRSPDGRVDASTRQLKRRCGDCSRQLLGQLLAAHGLVAAGSELQ